ncbi:MAG TPA: glycosyltransferase family 39 protein, partial [Kofleriaceae bacterium]|nr:glycosyltransferase family 39 protein [Kofleriaceae bacterium]
ALASEAIAPRRRLPITPVEIALVTLMAAAVLIPGIWSYQLVDPWETHYGEVSRRMLADDDWVHLHWQDESFRSKPALTFWLQASSMAALGVAEDGGYSGEMVSSPYTELAVRLPSTLFGVLGLVLTWWMLARLVSRRAAYIGLLVIATTPFYFFIFRQALTDIPMVACMMGAFSCFLLAMEDGDVPIKPFLWRITPMHVVLAALGLIIGAQALYYIYYFRIDPALARSVPHFKFPGLTLGLPMLLGLGSLVVSAFWPFPLRYRRQIYMLWFYVLIALSVLAKGLPGIGITGAVCLFYFIATGRWRKLLDIEIPRGMAIVLLIAVPWHVAMWLKDGYAFIHEYIFYHNLGRAMKGATGERGTFNYYVAPIAMGVWPWVALLPGALVAAVRRGVPSSPEGRVRLLAGLWVCVAVALFTIVTTKVHYYILPAIPALGILIALFIDDVLSKKVGSVAVLGVIAATIVLFVGHDLVLDQSHFIELFVYRHDRPWPSGPPWNIDLSTPLWIFTLLFAAALMAFTVRRARWAGFALLAISALIFTFWAENVYMKPAAAHWGQKALHARYYQMREIHGVDIKYHAMRSGGRCIPDLHDLARDFGTNDDYLVESVLPTGFHTGLPMTIRLFVPCAGLAEDRIELSGEVSRIGHDRFWIHVPESERETLSELITRGRPLPAPRREPWIQVNADRLLAWGLYWRGENFWSGGEIWGEIPETHTGFKLDVESIKGYLDRSGIPGRTYYVVSERGRKNQLRGKLPTSAKDTLKVVDDTSSNKFMLMSFTL